MKIVWSIRWTVYWSQPVNNGFNSDLKVLLLYNTGHIKWKFFFSTKLQFKAEKNPTWSRIANVVSNVEQGLLAHLWRTLCRLSSTLYFRTWQHSIAASKYFQIAIFKSYQTLLWLEWNPRKVTKFTSIVLKVWIL